MPKCAYRFGAPDATIMVRTATSVLHDARTRCLTPCDGQKPAESRGHFRPHGMQTRDKPVRKMGHGVGDVPDIHTGFFPPNLPLFSPELRSHRLVSPIRLSVLGRTYGTYLHYERSYSINVFFIRRFGQPRLRFDLRAKASDSREISPRFRGNFPAIPGKFPR